MNTKNNLKSRETKKSINEVFIKLLSKKPVSKVTVNEICSKSNINRSTFYRHYKDIYDLYDKLQISMMKDAHSAYFAPTKEGCLPFSRKCFQSLFQFIADNFDYYSNMVSHSESVRIVDFIQAHGDSVDMQALIDTVKLESADEEHFRLAYFDGGLNSIIKHWIKTGCSVTPENFAYFMEKEYQYEVAEIEQKSAISKKVQI